MQRSVCECEVCESRNPKITMNRIYNLWIMSECKVCDYRFVYQGAFRNRFSARAAVEPGSIDSEYIASCAEILFMSKLFIAYVTAESTYFLSSGRGSRRACGGSITFPFGAFVLENVRRFFSPGRTEIEFYDMKSEIDSRTKTTGRENY